MSLRGSVVAYCAAVVRDSCIQSCQVQGCMWCLIRESFRAGGCACDGHVSMRSHEWCRGDHVHWPTKSGQWSLALVQIGASGALLGLAALPPWLLHTACPHLATPEVDSSAQGHQHGARPHPQPAQEEEDSRPAPAW